MEDSMKTSLEAEKADLERKLAARKDNLCFQQNCRLIEARIAWIDEELASDG